MDDKPVLRIEAEKREIVRVEIVGTVYEFRRPKTSSTSNAAFRALADRVAEIRKANEGIDDDDKKITMTEDETLEAFAAVWRYLAAAIVDHADYAELRRRMYGSNISDEDALAAHHILPDDDDLFGPNPDDDLEIQHLGDAASALVQHWSEERVKKSKVRSPAMPTDHQPKKTATPGTTRTRKKTTARK